MAVSIMQVFRAKKHLSDLFETVNSQRKEAKYCDVVLTVDKQKFSVHKNILAASSEYFNAMFSSGMREQYENTIQLKGVTPHALKTVLDFIYTGEVTLSDENITEILEAASLLRILDLLEIIDGYLIKAVKPSTCLHFRNLGNLYSLEKLVVDANRCLHEHFEEISQQPDFNKLEKGEIESLISSDQITVKYEQSIFEAVVNWVKHDPKKRKQSFSNLFKLVRLQLISTDYLSDKIRTEPYVRECVDCRELVEDAFHFQVNPGRFKIQKPRKGKIWTNTDYILCIGQQGLLVYGIADQVWTNCKMPKQSLKKSSAIAFDGKKTVFCGGTDTSNKSHNSVIAFKGNTFLDYPSMQRNRTKAAAVFIGADLLVFGGDADGYQRFGINGAHDFEAFEESSKTWSIVGYLKTPRSAASCVAVQDCAYLIGGYAISNPTQSHCAFTNALENHTPKRISKVPCALVEIYNHTTKEWTDGRDMNTPRVMFGAAYHNSRIYAVGGKNEYKPDVTTSEFMDIRTGQWTTFVMKNPLTTSMGCCIEKKIYALGHIGNFTNSIVVLDTSTDQWEVVISKEMDLQSFHSIASICMEK